MKKTILALLLALMLTAAPALAIPSPSDDFYILDEANVISNATEEYIIYNNDQLYDACGAQIVFAVVDDTEGEAIDDYAYDLFNEWGIGDSKKDNGFLVLMAIDDDNYYALPGTGLERAISAGTVKDLLDTYLEPDFAAKDYDAGAKALFDALFTEVCDASGVYLTAGMPAGSASIADKAPGRAPAASRPAVERAPERDEESGGISIGTIVLIVIIIVIVLSVTRSKGKRRASRTHVPPVHIPPQPRKTVIRPVIIPRINLGPRPGNGPRPQPPKRTHHFGGGGSTRGGGAGRSFGSMGRSGGGFSRGGRSGGGGGSRGGGAGRGR